MLSQNSNVASLCSLPLSFIRMRNGTSSFGLTEAPRSSVVQSCCGRQKLALCSPAMPRLDRRCASSLLTSAPIPSQNLCLAPYNLSLVLSITLILPNESCVPAPLHASNPLKAASTLPIILLPLYTLNNSASIFLH